MKDEKLNAQWSELQRRELAFKRLASMYLEFGAGRHELRELVIRSIWAAPLEVLEECGPLLPSTLVEMLNTLDIGGIK